MIKFLGSTGERVCLGIGLSELNLQKLREGKPIHFNAEEMGLRELCVKDVIVMWGATEEDMERSLIEEGMVTKATKIIEGRNQRKM